MSRFYMYIWLTAFWQSFDKLLNDSEKKQLFLKATANLKSEI